MVSGFALLLAVILSGCGGGGGGAAPEVQVPEDASGVIVGVIETQALTTGAARATAASAARKVEGAQVYAFPADTAEELLFPDGSAPSAITDFEGRFIITGLPSGNHTLIVDVDADGTADGMILNITVAKEKTTDCGAHKAETLHPAPETAGGKNRRGTWCDVSLDKVIYATGQTLEITLYAKNETETDRVCGVLINKRKGKDHEEQWRSDFADASHYITVPAGGAATDIIYKVIPEEWALTNTNQGSDYQVFPITGDGSVWDKGKKDNFNILKDKLCAGGDDGTDCDADTGDDGTVPGDDGGTTGDDGTIPGDDGGTVPDDGDGTVPGDDGAVDDGGAPLCGDTAVVCSTDADCDDGDVFTTGACMAPGTCDAWCLYGDG